jgi:hypothetical protein
MLKWKKHCPVARKKPVVAEKDLEVVCPIVKEFKSYANTGCCCFTMLVVGSASNNTEFLVKNLRI